MPRSGQVLHEKSPRYVRLVQATAALALLVALLEQGFDVGAQPLVRGVVRVLDFLLVGTFCVEVVFRFVQAPHKRALLTQRWADLLAITAAVAFLAFDIPRLAGGVVILRLLLVGLFHLRRASAGARFFIELQRRPLATLVASFAILIALGTIALTFPAATTDHRGAPLLVALFTATSATCVTGLTVVETATYWSRFGHWILLVLIQIGGLGIMTITTALSMVFRAPLTLRERGAMQEILEEQSVTNFRRLIARVVLLTLAFEALGAALLFFRVDAHAAQLGLGGEGFETRLFHAVFHAVSAFCNAGFTIFSKQLVGLVGDVPINLTISILVVVGGLGFPVVGNLLRGRILRSPRRFFRKLPIHDRVVLTTTAILLGLGGVGYLALEWNGLLAGLSPVDKLLGASFASTNARTAGFDLLDYEKLTPPGLILTLALMFIGGSPGGTAGGIKTTTAAVMFLAVRAMLRGREDVEVYERRLPRANIYRAIALTAISAAVVVLALMLLLIAEPALPFERVLFEAFSAFGTNGASMGITPQLGELSRLLVAFLMFAGRIGPFTLAMAIGFSQSPARYSYPSGKIVVG